MNSVYYRRHLLMIQINKDQHPRRLDLLERWHEQMLCHLCWKIKLYLKMLPFPLYKVQHVPSSPPPQSIILEILEIQYLDPGKKYPHSIPSWTDHHGSILSDGDFWTPSLNKIATNERISRPPSPGGRTAQMVHPDGSAKKSHQESPSSRNIRNNCSK